MFKHNRKWLEICERIRKSCNFVSWERNLLQSATFGNCRKDGKRVVINFSEKSIEFVVMEREYNFCNAGQLNSDDGKAFREFIEMLLFERVRLEKKYYWQILNWRWDWKIRKWWKFVLNHRSKESEQEKERKKNKVSKFVKFVESSCGRRLTEVRRFVSIDLKENEIKYVVKNKQIAKLHFWQGWELANRIWCQFSVSKKNILCQRVKRKWIHTGRSVWGDWKCSWE